MAESFTPASPLSLDVCRRLDGPREETNAAPPILLADRVVTASNCPRPTGVCTPSQRLHQDSLDRLTQLLEALSAADLKGVIARRDAFDKGVRRVLEDGMAAGVFADGDPKLLAFALFGAVNWIPRWYSLDGPASSQAIADLFADLFVAGFRTGGV